MIVDGYTAFFESIEDQRPAWSTANGSKCLLDSINAKLKMLDQRQIIRVDSTESLSIDTFTLN